MVPQRRFWICSCLKWQVAQNDPYVESDFARIFNLKLSTLVWAIINKRGVGTPPHHPSLLTADPRFRLGGGLGWWSCPHIHRRPPTTHPPQPRSAAAVQRRRDSRKWVLHPDEKTLGFHTFQDQRPPYVGNLVDIRFPFFFALLIEGPLWPTLSL